MDEALKFSFNLGIKDYRGFNFWYLYGRSVGKWILALCLVFLVETPLLVYLLVSGPVDRLLLFLLGAQSMILVFYLVLLPLILYIQSGIVFKSDKFMQETHNYIAGEEGISVTTASSTIAVTWDEVYMAAESKRLFYVFVARNKALLIPKSSLSGEMGSDFRTLVRSRLDKAKLRHFKQNQK